MTARDATVAVPLRGGTGRRSRPDGDSGGAVWRIGGLEGRHVRVTLADGSQIDDCELISAGHHGVENLWVCADGDDMFVPLVEVTDVREVVASAPGDFP
jgi:hypothetical protein